MRIVRARSRHGLGSVVLAVGLLAAAQAAPAGSAVPARAAAPVPPTQDSGGGGTSLKAEYDEILGREVELVARVEKARAEQARLMRELTTLQARVRAKQVELLAAQVDLRKAEARATREAAARRVAEKRVVQAEERLRQQIVASFVAGGETSGLADAIMRADSGESAGNAIAYSRAIVGDSDALVRDLQRARAERRRAEKAARRARAQATARRNEVADVAAYLSAARDRQVTLVDRVNAQVLAENTALYEVKGRKARVEGEIASMNQTSDGLALVLAGLQAGQPEWKPGDVLITNPIPGYEIRSEFGLRRHPILGTVRLHAGGDIGAPSGTIIYAPADGVVILAGPRGGYGNATLIDHGFSLATLYGHQSRIDVKPGQAVKRGQPIGLVGSTGLSTGPHLHFETRLKGIPTDPAAIVDFTLPRTSYADEARALEKAFGG